MSEDNYQYSNKYNMWIRNEPYKNMDLYTLREVDSWYRLIYPYIPGSIVMDVGAHIGGFVKLALDRNAKRVIAYEPDRENFKVLIKNFPNITAIKSGISNTNSKLTMYKCTGTSTTMHSIIPIKSHKREKVTIRCRNFIDELNKYKPTLLKWDAEGAEDFVFNELSNLPDYIKYICIEISNMANMKMNPNDLIQNLENQFEIIDSRRVNGVGQGLFIGKR